MIDKTKADLVKIEPIRKLRFFMVKWFQNRQFLKCCKFRDDEKLQILARKKLSHELSIVKLVRHFRGYYSVLSHLSQYLDAEQIKREAKYKVLDDSMSINNLLRSSDSSSGSNNSLALKKIKANSKHNRVLSIETVAMNSQVTLNSVQLRKSSLN